MDDIKRVTRFSQCYEPALLQEPREYVMSLGNRQYNQGKWDDVVAVIYRAIKNPRRQAFCQRRHEEPCDYNGKAESDNQASGGRVSEKKSARICPLVLCLNK